MAKSKNHTNHNQNKKGKLDKEPSSFQLDMWYCVSDDRLWMVMKEGMLFEIIGNEWYGEDQGEIWTGEQIRKWRYTWR